MYDKADGNSVLCIEIFALSKGQQHCRFGSRQLLKGPSQPPPFPMPLFGEAKSYCFSVSCVLEGMFDYL